MSQAVELPKVIVGKSYRVDQFNEQYVEAVSRALWPWRYSLLLALVGFLAVLDYTSTYIALELSGNKYLYEGGLLANWALRTGGFAALFLFDLAAISTLLLAALTIRFLYYKFGFKVLGRTASVVMLLPYVVITTVAVLNNVTLTFL
ncbi:hypothetical protein ACFLW4_06950 [Chloroflexota bacterium]